MTDIKDYVPFYNKPVNGFGFDSVTFANASKTLVMHGRWTFYSESKYWVDKKTKQPKSKTISDQNRLVFAHANGRCEITYDANINTYSWTVTVPGSSESTTGTAATQELAEVMALSSIGLGFMIEPIVSTCLLTTERQTLALG